MTNGVAEEGAGLDATGATVTELGTDPPKFNVVAGSAAVAGIKAVVTPAGMVATCEFGVDPDTIVTVDALTVIV